jgi:hypothetical protein
MVLEELLEEVKLDILDGGLVLEGLVVEVIVVVDLWLVWSRMLLGRSVDEVESMVKMRNVR